MEQFLEANSTYFKFMFVRHPMSRILSCYLDKMVEGDDPDLPEFRNYVKERANQIIHKRNQMKSQARKRQTISKRDISRRRRSITTSHRILNNSFQTRESKSPVTNYIKGNNTSSYDENRKEAITNVLSLKLTPTFEEFLEFVLDSDLQGNNNYIYK